MKSAVILTAFALAATGACAKLPPPSEEAKAKAAEAKARADWSNSVAAFKLCQSQDKVVARYREEAQKQGKAVKPATDGPPCKDPGPFAYTPPAEKPIEASGAHSPPGTATEPPSTTTPDAQMKPKKP